MAHWEIKIPTVTADLRPGVQVFTYSAERFPEKDQAQSQARRDVASEDAIRHRRGADARPEAIKVIWHETYER
ncbi:hypothetical protein OG756_42145 (plasmid) [Streptomyces sp. NBC_01310]|uniref:hypothetical protein n=1 Tax=Streptomyces sp. NBC_01310 TaxID=2903820 RepID=UPI0035B5D476|nr:hypothetical protein OG756_42145 [Streptomyces sp. NBC_01310]